MQILYNDFWKIKPLRKKKERSRKHKRSDCIKEEGVWLIDWLNQRSKNH